MIVRFTPKSIGFGTLCLLIFLVACQKSDEQDISTITAPSDTQVSVQMDAVVGCYTVSHDEPAQIKISQDDGVLVMQMKEPKGSSSVWDKPEPLEVLNIPTGWRYFKANGFDISQDDIEQIVARKDGAMVLAQVKESIKNINPLLDSRHIMYIVHGSNTVYQVSCDDDLIDLL
ncbi:MULTISPECIES: hypothetical protein [unclassified Moraxella]|uniref:hypothetical protein n=1 Tax=unclassified Moraxella TaxID=2685852 RepID=UPI00359DAA8B